MVQLILEAAQGASAGLYPDTIGQTERCDLPEGAHPIVGQMAFRRERRSLHLPGPRAQPSAAALLTPKNPFCHCIIIILKWYKVVYDSEAETLSSCGTLAHLTPVDGLIRLRILLDRTSIEVYGNDGRIYIPHVVFPDDGDRSLRATCSRGEVKANYLRVHELKSIWRED